MILSKFGGLCTNLAPYLVPEGKAQDLYDVRDREGTLGKRPGMARKNSSAGDQNPLAIYSHVDESGNVVRLILANGSSRYMSSSGVATAISGGDFGTGPFRFATLRGLTVIAGTSKVSVFKDVSTFGSLTTSQPPAGTASTGTGSLPSGTYKYWFVYYSSQISQSGSPLGVQFSFSSTGTAPSIDRGSASTSGIWDRIAVYRSTVGGSTPLFHSLRQNTDFPFNDTLPDSSLGEAFSPSDAIQVADAIDVVARDDRIFLIRSNDRAVYYSESGKVSQFSALGYLVNAGSREVPVALAVALSSIFVFCRNSIWLIAGNTSDTYSMAKVVEGIGCEHRNSVAVINDRIYFRGKEGYYEFDGINRPILISLDIDKDAKAIPVSSPCASNHNMGEYVIFNSGTYGHEDIVYSFDPLTRFWWRDRFPSRCGGMMRSLADPSLDVFVTVDRFSFYSEHDEDVAYDGISSGTVSGVLLASSTASTLVTPGGLYVTGDGLKGCVVEVETSNGVYERREVLSNTATDITVSVAFSASTSSCPFVVCGIRSSWTSPRIGSGSFSRFKHWEAHFEESSAGGTLEFRFAVDAGGFDSPIERQMGAAKVYARGWVGHHGRRLAVKVECGGHSKPFALAMIEVDDEQSES